MSGPFTLQDWGNSFSFFVLLWWPTFTFIINVFPVILLYPYLRARFSMTSVFWFTPRLSPTSLPSKCSILTQAIKFLHRRTSNWLTDILVHLSYLTCVYSPRLDKTGEDLPSLHRKLFFLRPNPVSTYNFFILCLMCLFWTCFDDCCF